MIDPNVLNLQMDAAPRELPLFPQQLDCDFVYLFQTYQLVEGADIAIWVRSPAENCTRRVYATGAIMEFHSPIDLATLPFSHDEQIPRSVRIEKALEMLPRKTWPRAQASARFPRCNKHLPNRCARSGKLTTGFSIKLCVHPWPYSRTSSVYTIGV